MYGRALLVVGVILILAISLQIERKVRNAEHPAFSSPATQIKAGI